MLACGIGPVIESAVRWVNYFVHRAHFERLDFESRVAACDSFHHVSYGDLNVVVWSVALSYVFLGSPVEAYLVAAVMQDKR